MKLYNFIFSDRRPLKYYRHIIFWSAWLTYLVSLQVFNIISRNETLSSVPFWKLSFVAFAEVFSEAGCVYLLTGFLVPFYWRRGKKFLFVCCATGSFVLLFIIYYLLQDKTSDKLIFNLWFALGNFLGIGPVFICALFWGIQIMKNYYLKMEERETLSRETTIAELQALKARVHPHFLFNTLNNIYSCITAEPALATTLVRKLNNMLHYMIDECKTDLIPLEREINMIENYISLEKVRYNDRLDIRVEIKGNYQAKLVAPLLMIPFVENCFKHGASKTRGRQWIDLSICIENNQLVFKLSNSRPSQPTNLNNNKSGIGLANVQKRLLLLYPGNHELKIEQTDESYTVLLRILLYDKERKEKAKINPLNNFDPLTVLYA
jgi:hypothetical protein